MNNEKKSSRLEAFSDGVIAVIITIMVLELHVPHENGFAGLWTVAPRLAIYLLSFVMVGIYWINHHELCRRVETVDYGILWANLGWLFVLSLIPFFTDYAGEKHFDSFSTALYAAIMLFTGISFGVLRLAIVARQKRLHQFTHTDQTELIKHGLSMLFYVAAIFMAYRHVWTSFLLNLAVTLIWIAPELGTRKCEPSESSHIHPR
jgi:uncharacterized membrane protein